MSVRGSGLVVALLCLLGVSSSCRFDPDLSRFEPCAEDGSCAAGYTCLAEARRCLPDCGAQASCPAEPPADASSDAGPDEDGGVDGGMDGGANAGPLSLVTEVLEPAIELLPYTATLSAQGGTPPYRFRATQSLPQGLKLDGGVLSGTPATPGDFHVAVEVRDDASPPAVVSAGYELRVRPQLRVAGPQNLVDGYQDEPYVETVSTTGGTPPYRFTLEPGSTLPADLALDADGGVSGTPSAQGAHDFWVVVTDSDPQPQTARRRLSLQISAAPLALTIANQSVPDGRVGTAYQYTLRVAGNASVTWKHESGNLPGGIGFDPDTATLVGKPNEPGTFSFKISATGALVAYDEKTYLLTVE
ncbi:MAG: hemagglutinin [Myxococcaceae bacterium]|nr:hemagglutinin [Myxococcaceae bacterium]